jgi:iron complex outermembrane receptor protein
VHAAKDRTASGKILTAGDISRLQSARTSLYLLLLVISQWANAQQTSTGGVANGDESATQSETVIVTGTFAPVPANEIDRSVTLIDIGQQAPLYKSWVDALGAESSLDFRQRAPDDIQADVSIRGSSFGQTLVMLNGVRMDDAQSGHHDADLPLPTHAVEQIEIFKGAGSALYGSDAMAGTLNVITSTPEYSSARMGASVGNFGINQQYGSFSLVRKDFDQAFDAERDFSSGFRPDRDYRSATLFSRTGLKTRLGRSLLMLAYGDKPFGADQFYGPFNSWERTKSWFAAVKQDIGPNTEFDFAFRRHSDEFVLLRDTPSAYENNHIDRSWQADIRRHDQISQNSFIYYGAEGVHEDIVSRNFSGNTVSDALGEHERSRSALYVDYDVRALKRFSFSAAAREEFFDASHGEFNPTVAGGMWLNPRLKLRASTSRAFRLPSYTDWDYHDPANFGNPNLGPESAWDYEGGVVWTAPGRWAIEANVFERRDHNVIDYVLRTCSTIPANEVPSGAFCSQQVPTIYHAENLQKLDFTGVEISAEASFAHHQRLRFAYTELYGVQNELHGLQTKYTFNYPRHDGMIAWYGSLPGKLVARSRLGVLDRYGSSAYALWDAALAREFSRVAAHLTLSNISDTHYQEIAGVIMPGRSIVFGIDFFWRGH